MIMLTVDYKIYDLCQNELCLRVDFLVDIWGSHSDICVLYVRSGDFDLSDVLNESLIDDIKMYIFNLIEVEVYDENIHGNLDNDDNDGELVWKWK